MTERVAIIDLGSNSARLIIMHIYYNSAYNLVYHQKETVRLSEGMSEGRQLQSEAAKRAFDTLKGFAHMCNLFNVDKIIAVATAAVRNAKNGQEFLDRINMECNIPLRVVSGEDEARLGFLGVINTIDLSDALLFDLGGGSIELTLIRNRKIKKAVSLPFGAVNLTERFGTQNKASDSQLAELREYITQQFHTLPWLQNISLPIIGVGGTARNLAKMEQRRKNYPFPKVHNYRLGPYALEDLCESLAKSNAPERKRRFPGLSNDRADIIIAGAAIVKSLFDVTRGTSLVISGCGVREGLFLEYYLRRQGEEEIIPDILAHSTRNMLLFYKGHNGHAYHVAELAATMFDGWQELHGMEARERTLLRVASLLHDIGITINYYDHPRHSTYLVENARLFGLSHREQMLAAVVAGWHNGISAKYVRNKAYSEFLDEADWQITRRLALLLSLAESLDHTEMGLIPKVTAHLTKNSALLCLNPAGRAVMERQAIEKHTKWFKKEFGIPLEITE